MNWTLVKVHECHGHELGSCRQTVFSCFQLVGVFDCRCLGSSWKHSRSHQPAINSIESECAIKNSPSRPQMFELQDLFVSRGCKATYKLLYSVLHGILQAGGNDGMQSSPTRAQSSMENVGNMDRQSGVWFCKRHSPRRDGGQGLDENLPLQSSRLERAENSPKSCNCWSLLTQQR